MHMSIFTTCTCVWKNVTRLSQRVKDKSTMAEPAHKYSYLWKNILSGLHQMNKNSILPRLFIFFSYLAREPKSVHSSTSVFSYWDFALLPLETEPHLQTHEWVKSRVRANSLCFRSGTGEGEMKTVYKLLHTSHRAIAKATAFHKLTVV